MENRPTAAPRHERPLPRGKHRLQLHSMATPNGQKVTIALEATGAAYDAHYADITAGDQYGAAFTAANPNQKIPLLIDTAGPLAGGGTGDVPLMESGAILLYLADAFPASGLLPADPAARAVALQWLFWVAGAAPYWGQFGHFAFYQPTKLPYPIARYTMEAVRLLDVLDRRLADAPWVGGSTFSVADCAAYPWVECLVHRYQAGETLHVDERPHLKRWRAACAAHPAVKKGMLINGVADGSEFRTYSTAGSGATA